MRLPPDNSLDRRAFLKSSGVGLAIGMLGSAISSSGAATSGSGQATGSPATTLNVTTFGAKGDNTTDDTAAIQAAIDATSKAGGGLVFLPPGNYKTTAGLQCTSNNVVIAGIGGASTLRPVGDFDTLRFTGPGPTHIYRNRVSDLLIDERDKTGGRSIVGEYVSLFIMERVYGVFGWNAWHFHNFGYVTLIDCRFESYRGTFYGRATGGGAGRDKGRSDILRLIGLTHGGIRQDGIMGLDIDGFVHTVNGTGVYLVGIGGQGLWARNTLGAENNPSFFTFDDFECDFPDLGCIRLDAGEHFYFTNTQIHGTRRAASNIHIGPEVRGVSFTGGFSTGAQQAGIRIEGRDVALSAMHFHANSSPQFGGAKNVHPGIFLAETARDVIVTGCRSGQAESPDFQSCGCQIDPSADGFVITGNDFRHNVLPGVDNGAGIGPSKVIANTI
jgi:hypothetical protein